MIDEKKLIEDILKVRQQNVISEEVGYNRPFCDKTNVIECINNQPQIGEWIPCSERLPEEHESIFAKFKGTDKWKTAMFEKTSNEVIITVEDEKGQRTTMTAHTIDGNWKIDSFMRLKVIAWQPLPEVYHEGLGRSK